MWGATVEFVDKRYSTYVSIHAPVWGATPMSGFTPIYRWFQSTHPCGVRQMRPCAHFRQCGFNPRTRVGCDASWVAHCVQVVVSIHAPVWGATRLRLYPCANASFNPRTRVGCDRQFAFWRYSKLFQSTHPCGVRRHSPPLLVRLVSFNPRTRVGCDQISLNTPVIGVFQSTHPCGVRRSMAI